MIPGLWLGVLSIHTVGYVYIYYGYMQIFSLEIYKILEGSSQDAGLPILHRSQIPLDILMPPR